MSLWAGSPEPPLLDSALSCCCCSVPESCVLSHIISTMTFIIISNLYGDRNMKRIYT